ncbi:hypothetical protein chiPu_0033413, partial [Chiloscyllium punctatum]|nr:hypothetical protein [Chiloscyllium punctatum]
MHRLGGRDMVTSPGLHRRDDDLKTQAPIPSEGVKDT